MIKSTVAFPSLKSHIFVFFRKVSTTSLSAHLRVGKLRIAIGTFLKKQRLHKAPWSFLRTTSSTWELLIIRVLVVLSLTCQAYSTWICARRQTHGRHNHLKSRVSNWTLKYCLDLFCINTPTYFVENIKVLTFRFVFFKCKLISLPKCTIRFETKTPKSLQNGQSISDWEAILC